MQFLHTYGKNITMPPLFLIAVITSIDEWIAQLSIMTTEHFSLLATDPTYGKTKEVIANSYCL